MEQWQKDHVLKNISELIKLTDCNVSLLAQLQAEKLLHDGEIQLLNGIPTSIAQARKLYDILEKKIGSYDKLRKALLDTCQSGAYEILNRHSFKYIGKISYCKDNLLGKGCNNTKVYKGLFDDRIVAVKVLNTESVDFVSALKEVELLRSLDWHENIVKYYQTEVTEDYVWIALELCTTNLHEWVTNGQSVFIEPVEILQQATQGIAYLHSRGIIHRDLKPANILLVCPDQKRTRVKISDFGMSRKISVGNSRLTLHSSGIGTEGWVAPEVLNNFLARNREFRMSPAADIFSLGCIFYFVLTHGIHPFGDELRRQVNIIDNKSILNLDNIKAVKFGKLGFIWLIKQMIVSDEANRPPASLVLTHHVFWSASSTLQYLQDICAFIDKCANLLNQNADLVDEGLMAKEWTLRCSSNITKYIRSSFMDYVKNPDFTSIVKVIVKMFKNRTCLPEYVKSAIGKSAEEFLQYWDDRFPFLVPLIWTVFQKIGKSDTTGVIKGYYEFDIFHDFQLVMKVENDIVICSVAITDTDIANVVFVEDENILKSSIFSAQPNTTITKPSLETDLNANTTITKATTAADVARINKNSDVSNTAEAINTKPISSNKMYLAEFQKHLVEVHEKDPLSKAYDQLTDLKSPENFPDIPISIRCPKHFPQHIENNVENNSKVEKDNRKERSSKDQKDEKHNWKPEVIVKPNKQLSLDLEDDVKLHRGSAVKVLLPNTSEHKISQYNPTPLLVAHADIPTRIFKSQDKSAAWNSFSPSMQEKTVENLKLMFSYIDAKTVLPMMDGVSLTEVFNNRLPKLFKDTLPEKLKYYVDRTLRARRQISSNIFQAKPSCIVVLTGVTQSDLSKFAPQKMVGNSAMYLNILNDLVRCNNELYKLLGNNDELYRIYRTNGALSADPNLNSGREEVNKSAIRKLVCTIDDLSRRSSIRFMVLDLPQHFDQLCKQEHRPVHWIEKNNDGNLYWVKSRGDKSFIRANLAKQQEQFNEDLFLQAINSTTCHLPIIISDSPGMGKSILLQQLGRKLKIMNPTIEVLFIVLSEVIFLIKEAMENGRTSDLTTLLKLALKKLVTENVLAENILEFKLHSNNDESILLHLLIDGFDEVQPNDFELAHEVLSNIKKHFNSVRLWIASRPHHLNDLENSLENMGYKIEPFNEVNQINFLTRLWQLSQENQVDEAKLIDYAKICLKSLKSNMYQNDEDIAGIPLQCLLIGEAYQNDASNFVQSNIPYVSQDEQANSIPQLFEKMFKTKMKKYKSSFGQRTLNEEALLNAHYRLSFELLFPYELEYFGFPKYVLPSRSQELLMFGIMERYGKAHTLRFIHRTFAEFLVAMFIADKLKLGGKLEDYKYVRRIIEVVLNFRHVRLPITRKFTSSFIHPVICYFLNYFIGCLVEIPWRQLELFQSKREMYTYNHIVGEASFFADHIHIIKLFGDSNSGSGSVFSNSDWSNQRLAEVAVENANSKFIMHMMEDSKDCEGITVLFKLRLLWIAGRRGDFTVFEHIFNDSHVVDFIQNYVFFHERNYGEEEDDILKVLHGSVELTQEESDTKIMEREKIVRVILQRIPSLKKANTEGRKSLLESRGVHMKLLLELGYNAN